MTAALALAAQPLAARFVDQVDERVPVLTRVVTLLLEHAMQYGHVDVLATTTDAQPTDETDDRGLPGNGIANEQGGAVMGVAVWLSSSAPPMWQQERRLLRAAGWDSSSFVRYTSASRVQHRPYLTLGDEHGHQQLALLAVHPAHQDAGHARALLAARHQVMDERGQPAYVEAPGPLRAFFARHGYEADQRAAPFDVTGHIRGPSAGAATTLTPMWRASAPLTAMRSDQHSQGP